MRSEYGQYSTGVDDDVLVTMAVHHASFGVYSTSTTWCMIVIGALPHAVWSWTRRPGCVSCWMPGSRSAFGRSGVPRPADGSIGGVGDGLPHGQEGGTEAWRRWGDVPGQLSLLGVFICSCGAGFGTEHALACPQHALRTGLQRIPVRWGGGVMVVSMHHCAVCTG